MVLLGIAVGAKRVDELVDDIVVRQEATPVLRLRCPTKKCVCRNDEGTNWLTETPSLASRKKARNVGNVELQRPVVRRGRRDAVGRRAASRAAPHA